MKNYILENFDGSYTVRISPKKSRTYGDLNEARRVVKLLEDKAARKLHKWIAGKCEYCGIVRTTVKMGEYYSARYDGKVERPNCIR